MSGRMIVVPRAWLVRTLQILALFNLSLAHPLYQVLAASPEFFVAHRVSASDVLLMTFLVSVVFPAVLAGGAFLISRVSERAGRAVHLALLALLVSILGLQIVRHLGGTRAVIALPSALSIGAAAALAYARFPAARTFAAWVAPATLVVPLLFVAGKTVRPFVFPAHSQSFAPAVPARTPPIVLIIFDQLPLASLLDGRGRIDSRLYPGFAALAERSTWFRNATAVADYTGWALPPILTGLYPRRGTTPTSADFPDSLFTLLAGSYEMSVFEPLTSLCPDRLCPPDRQPLSRRLPAILADETIIALHVIAPEELAAMLPSVSQNWKSFAARDDWFGRWLRQMNSDRREQPNRFISSIRQKEGRRPMLYVLHALLPHEPFMYSRSGQVLTPVGFLAGLGSREIWTGDEWAIAQTYQAHLEQLGYADALLRRILDRLNDARLFDDAIIVVTADHGARFFPREPFRMFRRWHASDIISVPLLVKRPGQRQGAVSDENVETVDVTPTIAGLLGVRLPWKHDGHDVSDSRAVDRANKMVVAYAGTQVFRLPAMTLDDVHASARRKLSLFRDGDPRVPLTAPYPALLDRGISDLQVGPPWRSIFLVHEAWRFRKLDTTAEFLPARLRGEVSGDSDLPEPLPLAIAVNGRIRATTWTAGPRGTWTALVPPDAFRSGRNEVQVFVPREERDGALVLHPASAGRRSDLNLLSTAAADSWGVRLSGFHEIEANGSRWFRWTNGAARLDVPVDEAAPAPAALRIEVVMTANREPALRVVVNGCELYRGRVAAGWTRTLSLNACPLDKPIITIELMSDSFQPPRDVRRLGLALGSVTLLDNDHGS